MLHTLEENDRVSSEYEESSRVEARESGENVKMRGSWQSDTEYWVYDEVNKFDYEEMGERRREKAVREGFDYWWQGESSRNRGDLTIALACYLKGLEAIRPALNEDLLCSVEGDVYKRQVFGFYHVLCFAVNVFDEKRDIYVGLHESGELSFRVVGVQKLVFPRAECCHREVLT